ncbi:A disintegrin and metalloproteinase with thrombospondin motifs 16-like [Sycon ciliatum]|uniref:A disintegrin and metalloproteinase with thrombospondin motifs 16-like n=1 Tax=Sycon ciliatum TaxID=27933 RepID=UPI0031F65C34
MMCSWVHVFSVLFAGAVVSPSHGLETEHERFPGHGLHKFLTDQHLYNFFGTSKEEDYEYHTTNPSEVTVDGEHITFDLREAGHRRRRRRSTSPYADEAYFKVAAFDNDYHVAVQESSAMFSDHSVIELMGAEGNVTHRQPIMAPTHCYYRGHITGANDSLVAFSTCKGMTGAIFSPDDAFFIHPLPPYLLNHSANAHSHTHMVVRRSVDSDTSGPGDRKHCGVGLRKNPAGYREAQYNYIPFYAAMDEVRSKFNPKRKNVYSQYGPMYIETALVVDTYMYEQHDRDQDALKTYLLTLMNLMQAVFSPESTGLDITLHVTRIIYLTDHQPNMPIGHDSVALLDKFGTFQQRLNPVQDSNFIHHDFAMLLTGFDLCAADNRAGCGELGRAYIQSLCSPTTSAAVVRDRGIQNAVVMAHELGHVLGAYHDSSVCSPDEGYVMVGSATNTKKFWQFSDCSKAYFRSFLGTDETQCILDCPLQHHSLVVHDYMLPGQRYSREQQCQFQFPNHTFCSRFRPDVGRSQGSLPL